MRFILRLPNPGWYCCGGGLMGRVQVVVPGLQGCRVERPLLVWQLLKQPTQHRPNSHTLHPVLFWENINSPLPPPSSSSSSLPESEDPRSCVAYVNTLRGVAATAMLLVLAAAAAAANCGVASRGESSTGLLLVVVVPASCSRGALTWGGGWWMWVCFWGGVREGSVGVKQ